MRKLNARSAGSTERLAGMCAIMALALIAHPVLGQNWAELDYGTHGYVMSDSASYPLTERWQGPSETPFMTDRQTLAGGTGETGDAFYVADLSTGTLDALAATASGLCPGPPACPAPNWGYVAQAQTWIRFKDTLTFHVPAGEYPDGAFAILTGYAMGWLDAFSDTGSATGAGGGYYGNFTTNVMDSVNGSAQIYAYDSFLAYEFFELSVRLVDPGTVLNQQISVDANLEAGLGNAYLTSQALGANIQGIGTSNWTMQFDELLVPDGVSWNSASGVFMSVVLGDIDADGVPDAVDNCIYLANTDQRDTNADGFGNICDADLDDNCIVNFNDLNLFKAVFFGNDPHADLDGDGHVNFADLDLFKQQFFGEPGPSGVPNACD